MWTVPTKVSSWPDIERLTPERILDEYDGPRLFTTRTKDGNLLLAYQCAEDSEGERFLLVPASEQLVSEIENNQIALRDALQERGWAWLIDRDRHGSLTSPVEVDPRLLPENALPKSGIRLSNDEAVMLRVRMIGDGLTREHVPASVVRRAVDGATGAVRTLVHHVLSLTPSTGRPPETFRRYYDLPAVDFAFRSFEIAFGKPTSSGQPSLEETETMNEVERLLHMGLAWTTAQVTAPPSATPEWSSIIDALARLSPPHKGVVKEVVLSGKLTGYSRAVRLTRASTSRISEARKRLAPDSRTRTLQGLVREFDKDRLTFILRDGKGETIRNVSFAEQHYEDALLAFESEGIVTIVVLDTQPSAELITITFDAPTTSITGRIIDGN